MTQQAQQAYEYMQQRLQGIKPRIGLVLGSGLNDFINSVDIVAQFNYQDLPGFPRVTVAGHAGRLVFGYLADVPLMVMQGRAHYYEGNVSEIIKTYIRSFYLMGCEQLILTNAAGSLHRALMPGALVLLKDHINLMGINPLHGDNNNDFGPRFFAMNNAYHGGLRQKLLTCAKQCGVDLNEAVYVAVSGPSYETPAEIQAFMRLGADVVGMSTVPEVIVAAHCGLQVAAISCVTNYAAGIDDKPPNHEEVLAIGQQVSSHLIKLITSYIQHGQ
ncbi:MAG: purine-nucleoside phosphorylase [Gammaproteobacteria bacterium]